MLAMVRREVVWAIKYNYLTLPQFTGGRVHALCVLSHRLSFDSMNHLKSVAH